MLHQATAEQIQRARDMYCLHTDDIEVDDNARASISDGGTWVAAWVWLPNESQEDE